MATEFLRSLETEANSTDQRWGPFPQGVPVGGHGEWSSPGEARPTPGEGRWLDLIQHHSQLVLAVVEMETVVEQSRQSYRMVFANDYFRHLAGLGPEAELMHLGVLEQLSPGDQRVLRDRFRRHCLNALLHYLYGTADLVTPRLLHEPLVVALTHPASHQVQQLELRLRTSAAGLQVSALAPQLEVGLRACWPSPPTCQQVTTALLTEGSALNRLLATLRPDRYSARGLVLIEGIDVTDRETAKGLVQLLVGREPVVGTSQFSQANRLIKQLFQADDSLLLTAERQQAQLLTALDQPDWQVTPYPLEDLQESAFVQATERGEVVIIPDLSLSCKTQCERDILAQGARSLLLIPLVMRSPRLGHGSAPMLGLVGLTSNRPYAFSPADCSMATTLIPALTASMRYSVSDRFTTIHPSVRWRFEQEAERLSLGLPPAPIVFEGVYPLYGISDIRGSSDERNRAIQQDLITQFQLALAVVEAVQPTLSHGLVQQLWLDLSGQLEELHQGVTVDAEITLLRYLQTAVEAHFPFFAKVSPAAREAIARYQAAIDSDRGGVYTARAAYDHTIGSINGLLRETWNHWQQSMQAITPHYCDMEATDGIDHMIYTGQAIDPAFTDFQLQALRYEQLRAVCDCARQGFALKAKFNTDMEITHLVLVQGFTVDIMHDESTERLFDVRGSRDTRYEIVKKRIDKACQADTQERITQPGKLTVVYSTHEEWQEYQQYLRYLQREGIVSDQVEQGLVEPLPGVSGLKFARVQVLPG